MPTSTEVDVRGDPEALVRVVRFVLIVSVAGLAAAVALEDNRLVITQLVVIVVLAWMIYRIRKPH